MQFLPSMVPQVATTTCSFQWRRTLMGTGGVWFLREPAVEMCTWETAGFKFTSQKISTKQKPAVYAGFFLIFIVTGLCHLCLLCGFGFFHHFAVKEMDGPLRMFGKTRIVRHHADGRAFAMQALQQLHYRFAIA
jgi:hypothetical protein